MSLTALCLALPATTFAQTCEPALLSRPTTDIAVQSQELAEHLEVGLGHYRSRFWGRISFGDTPRAVSELDLVFGSDAGGTFIGTTEVRFLGGGLDVGLAQHAGDFTVCVEGGVRVGAERSAELEKVYTNAFGQTIGVSREDLPDLGRTSRLWHLDLSMDHPLGDVATIGLGVFAEKSVLFADQVEGSLLDFGYGGVSAGAQLLLDERIRLDASYRHPLRTFDDEVEEPDGWAVVRIAWIL